MTSPAVYSMQVAADAVGLHYDTFRKRWKTLRRLSRFPAPFSARPYQWRAEAVEAWKLDRERRLGELLDAQAGLPPANDDRAPAAPPALARLGRTRAAMAARMRGAGA